MTDLEHLSHDSFYNMSEYSQITIDYIDDTEDLISGNKEELGALSYRISTVLDVINPELKTDKETLLKLIEIIEEQLNKIEHDFRAN